ncbi:helix-turn-helix transcriptional regulator [Blastopirellula marina]|uniref:helix-turn-helix transcriptional regulator n=1 Tax=Blastopirellula marina TaxID=124 RepID=UPI001304C7F4|nr:helix-turn-helix transcriptional regulator [Blastopirellula marina]
MTIRKFREFETYADAVRDADLQMTLPRLQRPQWEIHAFAVADFHLQFGCEGGGNLMEGTARSDGTFLYLPLAGLQRANGTPMRRESILVVAPGCDFTISVLEEHQWCSIYVPTSVIARNIVYDAPCYASFAGACVVELEADEIAELRARLTRLRRTVGAAPELPPDRGSGRWMRRQLKTVCRKLLAADTSCGASTGRPPLVRSELARILRDQIACRGAEDLTIEDLATAADVSQRTLRTFFLEYFGVPPSRYLTIRRLNQVRSALRKGDPDETTVTAVAARFGFWHLGRFAGAYAKLFGEAPSDTLHAVGRRAAAECV